MRRLQKFWIVVPAVALLGGCRKSAAPGQSQTHETLVKEAIASMRDAASSMNRVTDPASAEQAVKVLQREAQNLQSLRQRLTGLGSASSPERDRVKQHSQAMIAASQGMQQAAAAVVGKIRAGQLPPDLAQRLAAASRDYGQSMVDFGQQATPLFE